MLNCDFISKRAFSPENRELDKNIATSAGWGNWTDLVRDNILLYVAGCSTRAQGSIERAVYNVINIKMPLNIKKAVLGSLW